MDWLVAIPLLPALAFVILAPLSKRARNSWKWVAVLAMTAALALSVIAFLAVLPEPEAASEQSYSGHLPAAWAAGGSEEAPATSEGPGEDEATGDEHASNDHAVEPVYHKSVTIAMVNGRPLNFGILLDPVSGVMLLVITIVGLAVQVYSLGYMHEDDRRGWYYAVLSLFCAAMLVVVLADNFLMLYMSWEVMGLCSYLLIGFWHEQEAPRKAAQKAFLTTRVGDVGFALGLLVMYRAEGSFDFDAVLPHAAEWAPGVAIAVALLLLFGAMGKSAQVPLHVWLPDAMAGPTPASALIHAATMVAAGVYLVLRALPIFEAQPSTLAVTMTVGIVTALVGGLLAAVQHDIKKVLAYSTISQLGYMFAALGAGSAVAGLFHLVTHAFFKSLLFLGAGVIIHATHTQDMREMGGLSRRMPLTTVTFTAGALALAGVFPLSGFWSKDEILMVLMHEGHWVTLALALVAAFVTAFYVARLWFRVFTGYPSQPHAHEGHRTMTIPMAVLALITLVIGFFAPAFARLLGHEGAWPALGAALGSSAVAVAGLTLGWWAYGRRHVALNTRSLKSRAHYLYDALAQKLYFDVTYEYLVVRPFERLATWLAIFDLRRVDGVVNGVAAAWRAGADQSGVFDNRVIDGAVNGIGHAVRAAGARLRRLQVGRVQTYQRSILGATVLMMLAFLLFVVKGV